MLNIIKKTLSAWLQTGDKAKCRYNLYLDIPRSEEEKLDAAHWDRIAEKADEEGILFLDQCTDFPEIYHFGYRQSEPDTDHPAGYVWSSRASAINEAFGADLIEIAINHCCYAMKIDDVNALINGLGYEVAFVEIAGENAPCIKLTQKKGE